MSASSGISRLPLHDFHVRKGAKLGLFGQWEVPLYYSSILEEHEAVRARAGLFDISHMGKFYFSGRDCEAFLDQLLPRSVSRMVVGQALYAPLLNDEGGFVDDIILYRLPPGGGTERYFMIVNAGNAGKDFEWIQERLTGEVVFEDQTRGKSLIALQGPAAGEILEKVFGKGFADFGYYRFKEWQDGMIARTGYTGEDGFEVMAGTDAVSKLWEDFLKEGTGRGLVPVGFGARDTLRLEAAMLLYGHDMDENATPLEAGIEWALDFSKKSFVGREALMRQKENGIRKKLVGFEMIDRGIPRQDHEIVKKGSRIGKVTSGTFAPTLKKNLGLGYVSPGEAWQDNEIEIVVRERPLKARVVQLPFYKRRRS